MGITRELVRRLVNVFPSVCASYQPVCGSLSATYAEAYRRLLDLGRRSKASSVRPWYVWGGTVVFMTAVFVSAFLDGRIAVNAGSLHD